MKVASELRWLPALIYNPEALALGPSKLRDCELCVLYWGYGSYAIVGKVVI